MNGEVPESGHAVANLASNVLHPFVVAALTLVMMLWGQPIQVVVTWVVGLSCVLTAPLIITQRVLTHQRRFVYLRSSRAPLYLVAELSILVAAGMCFALKAPSVLVACMVTLAIWVPLQWAVNHWFTKISIHTAVLSGCLTALIVTGQIAGPAGISIALTLISVMIWARVSTRNHSMFQALLGVVLAAAVVLVIFPLTASWTS